MNTNKSGMGGQDHRGGTGVLDEQKEKQQGGKEQGKYGQHKPEQGKQDFGHQSGKHDDKGGRTEHSNQK